MHTNYSDIIERIPEPPRWWFNGVPRYNMFTPADLSVGSIAAGLVRVRCQDCNLEFDIGIEQDQYAETCIFEQIASDEFSYGDPPRHSAPDGSRCSGETNSAIVVQLLEAWLREGGSLPFVRRTDFERLVGPR